jgi:ABC-type microcin C transport system permease subunit YejE
MSKGNYLGCLMMIAAVFLGLYVGVYVCFIGGFVDILNQIKSAEPVSGLAILWALIKITIATGAGWVSFFILAIPGFLKLTKIDLSKK